MVQIAAPKTKKNAPAIRISRYLPVLVKSQLPDKEVIYTSHGSILKRALLLFLKKEDRVSSDPGIQQPYHNLFLC
jgi:hypothetical protein